jgi:CheY-like chemotaxis protein
VIRLPVSQAAAESQSPSPADVRAIRSRVVIIDDNSDAAKTMAMLIEQLGASVRTAHDARSGLEAVHEFRPEIAFLDIGMPGMDGYEVCRRIRQAPGGGNLVVVAVTGWGQPQDKQRALDAGFDAHLTKPVDPAALARLLASTEVS